MILLAGLYRSFNLLRVALGISPVEYLRKNGFSSSLALMAAQSAAIAAWALSEHFHGNGYQGWLVLAVLQLVISIIMMRTTLRQQRKTTPLQSAIANKDLPSITVCIPARNETESLESCLRSLIESDYPKLEILVLDDCSQDRTSDIIKGFAHDGVRFVKGRLPPKGWLAKNWAYQQLVEEANGDILIFCGVDIRFGTSTLRQLVMTLLAKRKQMISVMPLNKMPSGGWLRAMLVQPVRYAWELSIPRRLFNRPAVLSSCWIARRELLEHSGNFSGVKSSISPESHFARAAIQTDGYSFVRDGNQIGVSSLKTFQDQMETAVRTRYPQLHRRPELVMAVSLIEVFVMLASLPIAVAGLALSKPFIAIPSIAAGIIGSFVFTRIINLTYGRVSLLAWVISPIAVIFDIGIRHYSMWKYEFSSVEWKGRNVCLPVMRIDRHLPNMK